MYIVFELLIVIGQFIFALGCQSTSMQTMLLGRIVFGLGGESLNICQNAMIVKWFFKSQIALPLGLTISISRLGSVLNDVFSPRLVSNVTIF
jgi:nitrate/nitrite transporter NarK